jgi:prevent-host-death family protein
MRSMTAHEAKARFGQLLDAARSEPVTINKHGRAVAVVISKEEFDAMEKIKLEKLRTDIQKGIQAVERGNFVEVDKTEILGFGDSIKSKNREQKTGQ